SQFTMMAAGPYCKFAWGCCKAGGLDDTFNLSQAGATDEASCKTVFPQVFDGMNCNMTSRINFDGSAAANCLAAINAATCTTGYAAVAAACFGTMPVLSQKPQAVGADCTATCAQFATNNPCSGGSCIDRKSVV